ncbi:MAG: acetate kinase [Bacteroidales bacterium]|nr:acetate kinase [Bacteroidales bacterium]MDD2569862.1 acetate kinase [Bacteroidales bacterium]MDD2811792.1 acetate kinase [Bacteroidales bacterium]MDD3384703.1 acetate kinase [Bacteroidales bacterium]MDD3810952.1 acetate kinase [Bacteroidales bacterium]
MKILVLNCGSSSIKYQLFNMTDKTLLAKGIVEKVGLKGSFLKHTKANGQKITFEGEILDHQTGIEYILGVLTSEKHGCIAGLEEINAVGHRVAHGGEHFNDSAFIDSSVHQTIENLFELAPLHNPANLKGIDAMAQLIPGIQQVAVFDTSFHQTIPDYAYMYGIPYSLYKKYKIRRYGFHGTSHRFVAHSACQALNVSIEDKKIITCHLGNGASIAAISGGNSVDTSMGFTPVEGLIMGTRAGDLDLGVLTFIMDKEEIDQQTANTLVNKHSGMLGISGVSSDMREIENEAWNKGNERALLALKMFEYRVTKYIGAYAAAMNGVDILIFTGGIGENGPEIREAICQNLQFLGVDFDQTKNDNLRGKLAVISQESSKVTVMVVPTNEELVIAEDTERIVKAHS